MPQRDASHARVINALGKAGWEITHDPYVLSYDEYVLFVDIGAVATYSLQSKGEQIIGLRQADRLIAVEIKEFLGKSFMTDLERAIGQYILYRLLLKRADPRRELYLAISEKIYTEMFTRSIGEAVINDVPLQLIVIDLEAQEVLRWITPSTTGIS